MHAFAASLSGRRRIARCLESASQQQLLTKQSPQLSLSSCGGNGGKLFVPDLFLPQKRRYSDLFASTGSVIDADEKSPLDVDALLKYAIAVSTQMSIFYIIANGLDRLSDALQMSPSSVPFALQWFLFYVTALRSRVFNPLINRRPQTSNFEVKDSAIPKRKMPTWTPPGFVFPIIWLLLIGNLRAISTSLIVRTTGSYAHPAFFALLLHLSIGDTWNTVNNIERRYGTSVTGVFFVWLANVVASYMYYKVKPLAGMLLGVTTIWLTIASALTFQTWRLNPIDGGKLDPLYPVIRPTQPRSQFLWFSKAGKSTDT
jgi:translocator protein